MTDTIDRHPAVCDDCGAPTTPTARALTTVEPFVGALLMTYPVSVLSRRVTR